MEIAHTVRVELEAKLQSPQEAQPTGPACGRMSSAMYGVRVQGAVLLVNVFGLLV